jgi:hypothetical protein
MMKKKLQPKRFYLSFEIYLRGPKRKKPSANATFVPTTEHAVPDINTEEDDREYGIKMIHLDSPEYRAVTDAVEKFAQFLKDQGEIE